MATFGTFVAGQVLTAAELNSAGTWQDYTPTWTQSATITKTVNWARYMQLNDLVIGSVKMTASSAGTANNKILIGLPVTASSNNAVMGSAQLFQSSDSTGFRIAVFDSGTAIKFFSYATTDYDLEWGKTGGGSLGETISSGLTIFLQFMYEAA
jgi:hypothetical protein